MRQGTLREVGSLGAEREATALLPVVGDKQRLLAAEQCLACPKVKLQGHPHPDEAPTGAE
jgi:hypothetical protein